MGGQVQEMTFRQPGVYHRKAVGVPDKLGGVPVVSSFVVGVAGGSLPPGTIFYAAAIPGNRYGVGLASAIVSGHTNPPPPPGNINSMAFSLSQVAGAEFYDVFMSTDAQPKWVGRIREDQRAAGANIGAAYALYPGSVVVGIQGTGLAVNDPTFSQNTAYTPAASSILPIKTAGHPNLRTLIRVNITSFAAAPSLSLIPFLQGQLSGDWFAGPLMVVPLLSAPGATLLREFDLNVMGAKAAVILVDSITSCTLDCWAETV